MVLRHLHFPVTAIVSLVSPLKDDACAEVAVVGREGVVEVCSFMAGGKALSSAVVQRPGRAWRMTARDIADLARECEPVMQQGLRYTQTLFTNMAQSSACNRHPAVVQQSYERLRGDASAWPRSPGALPSLRSRSQPLGCNALPGSAPR